MLQWGSASASEDLAHRGIEAAHKAIELNPRLPDGYKAEALVRRATGDPDAARALLRKAVEADPQFSPAILNLAVDAYCHADLAAAERFLRRALEIDPQECFALTWLTIITLVTLRFDEALALVRRTRAASSEVFYVTAAYSLEVSIRLAGDLAEAEAAVNAGIAAGAEADTMRASRAHVAARSGRVDEARQALDAVDGAAGLSVGALVPLAAAAVRLGELERAVRVLQRPIVVDMAGMEARLEPDLHPLLDLPPFAPRRLDATLVWPLEAPMIDRARFRLFREVRIESGIPEGTELR
jgi:Tfp pilus assembly protein PilF